MRKYMLFFNDSDGKAAPLVETLTDDVDALGKTIPSRAYINGKTEDQYSIFECVELTKKTVMVPTTTWERAA